MRPFERSTRLVRRCAWGRTPAAKPPPTVHKVPIRWCCPRFLCGAARSAPPAPFDALRRPSSPGSGAFGVASASSAAAGGEERRSAEDLPPTAGAVRLQVGAPPPAAEAPRAVQTAAAARDEARMSPIAPRCCLARFPHRPPRPPRPLPLPPLAGVLGLSGSQFTSRGLLVADAARHGARWVRGGMLVRAPRRRCHGSRAPYRVLARAYVRHMWLSMRHPRRLVTPLALVCSPLRARCPTPPHLPSTPSPAPLTVPYRRRTRARDALPPPRAAATAVGGGRGFDEPPPPKSLQPSPPAAPPARPRTLACDRRCSKRSPAGTREQPPSCNEPPGRMGSMAQSGECPTTPPPSRLQHAHQSHDQRHSRHHHRHRHYQYHRHHTLPITTTTQPHPATDPNQRHRHPPPRPPPPPPCLCPLLPSRDQLVAVGRGGLILR